MVSVDENYVHNVAINERGKGIIEPQIRLQWFVDVNKPAVDWKGKQNSLKEVMQAVINDGDIDILPERFEKTYFHWIDNLRDWCISRQIWWGHRIPVWYRTHTDGRQDTYAGVLPPTDQSEGWNDWEQDPDTLDTWFSSALWTWSTLIDPALAQDYSLSLEDLLAKSPDFQAYHPTSVMETGWDILFFWVARMILATTYATGQVPFKHIYLHGMVKAEDGKKMSKSRPDSIINPLDIIPQYGTDALRMALIMGVSPGNDQNWSTGKIEANRNFCNKLWNIARYIETIITVNSDKGNVESKSAADDWMLSKLQLFSDKIQSDLDNFRFGEAYDSLYHFIWDDLADWYIEASKNEPNAPFLKHVLESVLLLAHPMAPFVTETIWQTLDWESDSLLASKEYSKPMSFDAKKAGEFGEIQSIVSEARFIIKALKVSDVTMYYTDESFITENSGVIMHLARLKAVTSVKDGTGIYLTSTSHKVWLDIDKGASRAYIAELEAQIAKENSSIAQLQGRLANKNYVDNAPSKVVEETKSQLVNARKQLEVLAKESQRFA